jgi:hypothetical protein
VCALGPTARAADHAVDRIAHFAGASTHPERVGCGTTESSVFGHVQYTTNLIRPGRIHIVAAEEGTGKTNAMTELADRMSVPVGR